MSHPRKLHKGATRSLLPQLCNLLRLPALAHLLPPPPYRERLPRAHRDRSPQLSHTVPEAYHSVGEPVQTVGSRVYCLSGRTRGPSTSRMP